MSLAATTWALHDAPTTSAQELVILWAMADVAHSDGTASFQKQATLAKFGRCDERTVRRHLKTLEERGLIRRGDQRLVAHLPGDKRPVVWDLNLSMRRGDDESEPVDNSRKRADKLSPRARTSAGRQPERPDTDVPSRGDTGDRSRGDTRVRQNRPVEPSNEPREGGYVPGEPHQAATPAVDNSPDELPPMHCPRHPGGTTEACGACGERRRIRKDHQARQAHARAAEHRAEVVARNATAAQQVTACNRCDRHGFVAPGVACVHDPAVLETARRGSAAVRAVLAQVQTRLADRKAATPSLPPLGAAA